jgi:type IV pilus assembly protein PilX
MSVFCPPQIVAVHVRRRQEGSLLVSAAMLLLTLMLAIGAVQIAIQGGKSARNERDRQIAFHAAEAALLDAELDIEHSPDSARSRSHIFSSKSALGFPREGEPGCNDGTSKLYLGLCRRAIDGAPPVWQTVDFADSGASSRAVSYGRFTGKSFQTGGGALPSKPPQYIIELFSYNKPGESADWPTYMYRITAVGFGTRETTQVALQTFYRKEGK